MAKQKEPNEKPLPSESIKVRFVAVWSGDRGLFPAGAVADLPGDIALSLIREQVAVEA